jgi:transglutaminase-like putative cysteine protease
MILAISHRTTYRYDPKVAAVAMRVKLFPSRFDGQKTRRWAVTLNGDPVEPEFTNGWGDRVATLFLRGGVEAVEVIAEGEIETSDLAGVLRGFRAPLRPGVCLRTTSRTRADAAIIAIAREAEAAAQTPLDRAHALQDLVSARIAYRPGVTESATTAAAALEAGEGVCQDHAHVLIAASRALGWPARYVAGYYLPHEDGSDDVATHAWAEIWVSGLGWIGFDASNDLCPTDAYVRVCSGLDAIDAAPLRGHAEGLAEETMEIAVSVRPQQSQSQSQG